MCGGCGVGGKGVFVGGVVWGGEGVCVGVGGVCGRGRGFGDVVW